MLYLTQTLFVPWLLAALALGLLVGWWSLRRTPPRLGLGWLGGGIALFAVALFVAGMLAIPGRPGLWFDIALHCFFWYLIGCCLGSLVAIFGLRDGRTEPVPAWVKPVRSEAAAADPAAPEMPDWIQVRARPVADVSQAHPALRTAHDWLDVLRGRRGPEAAAIPDWVRPVLPSSATDAAPVSAAATRKAMRAADAVTPATRVDLAEADLEGERPSGLKTPRGGKADDLKRIRGIGPQNEGRLHGLGIWHFDQIAAWTADNALWVGSYLAFPGRIEREDWVGQARKLAEGLETEFSKRVDKGQVASSRDDGTRGSDNVETIAPRRAAKGAPPKARGKTRNG